MDSAALLMSKKINSPVALLFVCFGNICRSPVFAALLRHLIREDQKERRCIVDSCGLNATFTGAPPHQQMQEIARQRNIVLEGRARVFTPSDFSHFTAIFGVTKEVVARIRALANAEEEQKKVFLATHFSAKYRDEDIPDPYYYGQPSSFEAVWEIIEDAAKGIYTQYVGK